MQEQQCKCCVFVGNNIDLFSADKFSLLIGPFCQERQIDSRLALLMFLGGRKDCTRLYSEMQISIEWKLY